MNPDSLIWIELDDTYEVIDDPKDYHSLTRSLQEEELGITIQRKILKVNIHSFSVYAVVSTKVDSQPVNRTRRDY